MNIRSIVYCIKQGFVNIRRNKLFSLASIGTIAACILLIGIIFSIIINVNEMEKSVEKKIGITVFFDKKATKQQKEKIGEILKNDKRVDRLEYTSADEAWKKFKKDYFKDDPELAEGFASDNPLADSESYTVFLKQIKTQSKFVKDTKKIEGVRKVNYSNAAKKTLNNIKTLLGYVSLALIVVLLAVGIFLINNTVMIGISVRKNEIKIMKLIGSTNAFVRAPFVIEGVAIGVIGSVIPIITLMVAYGKLINLLVEKFGMFANNMPFASATTVFSILIPLSVGIGAGIGLIGSAFSIRKHLKV